MGAHVQRMNRRGCNLEVIFSSPKTERRVNRIIVAMYAVVQRAWMERSLVQYFLRDRGRLHVTRVVTPTIRREEDRQRIERSRI